MVVEVETQDRVRHLLQEALPMLCKSGLAFASEFSVEALIGITLNKDDVFLVSIKETVKSDDSGDKSIEVNVSRAENAEGATSSQQRKTHRKRRRSKTSRGTDSESSAESSSNECEGSKICS